MQQLVLNGINFGDVCLSFNYIFIVFIFLKKKISLFSLFLFKKKTWLFLLFKKKTIKKHTLSINFLNFFSKTIIKQDQIFSLIYSMYFPHAALESFGGENMIRVDMIKGLNKSS